MIERLAYVEEILICMTNLRFAVDVDAALLEALM